MANEPGSPRHGDLDFEAPRILRELADNGVLVRIGWEGLLRHFLKEYHDGNVFPATPEELRATAARALGPNLSDLLSANEQQLAAEVFQRWLHIDKLPRDSFIELQQNAANDCGGSGLTLSHAKMKLKPYRTGRLATRRMTATTIMQPTSNTRSLKMQPPEMRFFVSWRVA